VASVLAKKEPQHTFKIRSTLSKKKRVSTQEKSDFAIALQFSFC